MVYISLQRREGMAITHRLLWKGYYRKAKSYMDFLFYTYPLKEGEYISMTEDVTFSVIAMITRIASC